MRPHVAIITGRSPGLGRAMTLGLTQEGYVVVAVGHIAPDVAQFADLRHPAEYDRVMSLARDQFGAVHILINSAGLTFTYIRPDLYRRPSPPPFWEAADEIVQTVMNANYVAADPMARRVAPHMVRQGWGRIVNVTTKLDTMNRSTGGIYGASKAALEMATEICANSRLPPRSRSKSSTPAPAPIRWEWPKRVALQAEKDASLRYSSRRKCCHLCRGCSHLMPTTSMAIASMRIFCDSSLPPAEAAQRAGRPAGLTLHAALNPREVAGPAQTRVRGQELIMAVRHHSRLDRASLR